MQAAEAKTLDIDGTASVVVIISYPSYIALLTMHLAMSLALMYLDACPGLPFFTLHRLARLYPPNVSQEDCDWL